MTFLTLHRWDVSVHEALEIQCRLRKKVLRSRPRGLFGTVAGADVSWERKGKTLFGAVAVFRLDDLSLLEFAAAEREVSFPYVPGLLSFREVPVLVEAFSRLHCKPDCIICDGQGLAHPRRMGLACHLGLLLDVPTVGCAKSILVGTYDEPENERGAFSDLVDKGEVVGAALRTRKFVKPVFVSPGHRMDVTGAIEIVLKTTPRFRIPEPVRFAHRLVNDARACHGG